ncbi:hypothetical protein AMQ83_12270 [Paenibacillus riograndensis]|nr:hypothetical protein AMQ83_12270 [Paenibacillus riograndensis]
MIASYKTVEEIGHEINAASLAFLTTAGLIQAIGGYNSGDYKGGLCLSCFDNDVPSQVVFGGEEKDGCSC